MVEKYLYDARHYQILVVRATTPGPVGLVLVEEVYRYSTRASTKGHGSKPFAEAVPAACCAGLKVRWMQSGEGDGKYFTSCLEKTQFMEPHNLSPTEATILFEVPHGDCKFEESSVLLKVALSKAAQACVKAAADADLAEQMPKKLCNPILYAVDSFPPTAAGKNHIVSYMEELKCMYEAYSGKPLVDGSGHVVTKSAFKARLGEPQKAHTGVLLHRPENCKGWRQGGEAEQRLLQQCCLVEVRLGETMLQRGLQQVSGVVEGDRRNRTAFAHDQLKKKASCAVSVCGASLLMSMWCPC